MWAMKLGLDANTLHNSLNPYIDYSTQFYDFFGPVEAQITVNYR